LIIENRLLLSFRVLTSGHIADSTASIIYATTPIWTSLIGLSYYPVLLLKRQWLGILIGFIGILIIFNFDVAGFSVEDLSALAQWC